MDLKARRWGFAVVALVAAACGTAKPTETVSTDERLTPAWFSEVADRTKSSGDMHLHALVEGDMTVAVPGREAVTLHATSTMTGGYDADSKRLSYHLANHYEGDQRPQAPDVEFDVVSDAGIVYQRSSLYERLDPSLAGKWLKIDSANMGTSTSGGTAGNSDPTALLEVLRGAGAHIDDLGHETVNGEDMRHFKTRAKMADIIGRADAAKRKSLQQSLGVPGLAEGAQATENMEMDLEVWVDGQHRARKVVAVTDVASMGAMAPGAKLSGTMTQTSEFSEFGTGVTIELPPAAETVDGLTALRGATGGSSSSTPNTVPTTRRAA